uniref:Uncharacterized protein n=1 Tax=Lepeophtheirus salmonis TaxID=72036 RepID=A0A0K2TJX1_LEPSM
MILLRNSEWSFNKKQLQPNANYILFNKIWTKIHYNINNLNKKLSGFQNHEEKSCSHPSTLTRCVHIASSVLYRLDCV